MTFPALHVRPERGWLNDPNGLCRVDGRYHVFFQFNPQRPVHAEIGWGHASSADLLHWEYEGPALLPRPGGIDAAGCWSGCIIDDDGVPTAVYTAVPDHAWNGTAALATADRTLSRWSQPREAVVGSAASPGSEVRDPFVFWHGGRRYAIQGSGARGGDAQVLLYDCADLAHWTELGPLLSSEDPIAARVASASMWECPNLVRLGDSWLMVISLLSWAGDLTLLQGVRWLLGDLDETGAGLRFVPTAGGVLDGGPAFYAPQLLVDENRVLTWGWAWELNRTQEQIADAGWAGVLTFPRELYPRGAGIGARPARELRLLRREALEWEDAVVTATAFEVEGSGPIELGLGTSSDGIAHPVASAVGTAEEPARILVDGSIVEVFQGGETHTTRAYPSSGSEWFVRAEPGSAEVFRLGLVD